MTDRYLAFDLVLAGLTFVWLFTHALLGGL